MSFLQSLLGDLDPVSLAKKALTGLAAGAVKPALTEFFNDRMNAASRGKLGDELISAGQNLKAGNVAAASEDLSQVIEQIKL